MCICSAWRISATSTMCANRRRWISSILLQRRGADVSYTDPFVPLVKLDGLDMQTQDISTAADADCVVVVTDHSKFDYQTCYRQCEADCRHA